MKLRDDIVLKRIDGVYVLIALKSAWDDCPFAIQIAPFAALIWQNMKSGRTESEIINELMEVKGFDKEKSEKLFRGFIKAAENYHYFTYGNEHDG